LFEQVSLHFQISRERPLGDMIVSRVSMCVLGRSLNSAIFLPYIKIKIYLYLMIYLIHCPSWSTFWKGHNSIFIEATWLQQKVLQVLLDITHWIKALSVEIVLERSKQVVIRRRNV